MPKRSEASITASTCWVASRKKQRAQTLSPILRPSHTVLLRTPRARLQKLQPFWFWQSSPTQPLRRTLNTHHMKTKGRNVTSAGSKRSGRAAGPLLRGGQSSCSELSHLAQGGSWHCWGRKVRPGGNETRSNAFQNQREWLEQEPSYHLESNMQFTLLQACNIVYIILQASC